MFRTVFARMFERQLILGSIGIDEVRFQAKFGNFKMNVPNVLSRGMKKTNTSTLREHAILSGPPGNLKQVIIQMCDSDDSVIDNNQSTPILLAPVQ